MRYLDLLLVYYLRQRRRVCDRARFFVYMLRTMTEIDCVWFEWSIKGLFTYGRFCGLLMERTSPTWPIRTPIGIVRKGRPHKIGQKITPSYVFVHIAPLRTHATTFRI